jgi:hypothetical protein
MSLTFYDSNGQPIAYSDDGEHIFSFAGAAVGYLHGGSVWNYSGKHLGRFDKGWLRDNNGDAALFTDDAFGGPLKPLKQLKPLKDLKQLLPMTGLRELTPLKPLNSLEWSKLSGEHFFT